MTLDNSGWYPGNGINNTPDADTSNWDQPLINMLRETRSYYRKAVRAINDYIAKAKANAGMTPSTAQKFGRRS